MTHIALQTAYWPSIAWCSAAWLHTKVELEALAHYQKGTLSNRCHLVGPNGLQRLSIPLMKGKHQQTPITEVRIYNDEAWQRQHWRTIRTAYGSAPYFEHYVDELKAFYEKKYVFLFDFNTDLTDWVLRQKLGWEGSFTRSTVFELPTLNQEPYNIKGDSIGTKDLIPNWFFAARYGQVFQERHGFVPNLSVLDLLLCCGKQSVGILQKSFVP